MPNPVTTITKYFWHSPLLLTSIMGDVLLPLAIAGVSGNLTIPHNDSWAYSKIAQVWAETGEIDLVGWNRAALVGQFVFLGPLAHSVFVQSLVVCVFGILALVCLHEILRQAGIPKRESGIAVIAFGLWPGFSLLTTSFMEDIPAISVSLLGVFLAQRAIARNSSILFICSLISAAWSFSIRESGGIAVVLGIIVVATVFLHSRRLFRVFVVMIASMVTLVLLGVFYLWRSAKPNADATHLALTTKSLKFCTLVATVSFFELSCVVGPVILLSSRIQPWRARSWVTASVTLCIGTLAWNLRGTTGFFLPNYLSRYGAYSVAWSPSEVFSLPLWNCVVVFAICMGSIVMGQLATLTNNSRQLLMICKHVPVAVAFSTLTLIGVIIALLSTQGLFDRYLLPLLPILYISTLSSSDELNHRPCFGVTSILRETRIVRWVRIRALFGAISIGLIFGISMAVSLNAWSRDATIWDIALKNVSSGIPASSIDAGLAWIGWNSPGPVVNRQDDSPPWGRMFNLPQACMTLTSKEGAMGREQLVEILTYKTFMFIGKSNIYVYEEDNCVQ